MHVGDLSELERTLHLQRAAQLALNAFLQDHTFAISQVISADGST